MTRADGVLAAAVFDAALNVPGPGAFALPATFLAHN